MSQPTPMTPIEQDALVKQIGLTLMRYAPEGWHRVVVAYRAAGRYFELAGEVWSEDGTSLGWQPPKEVPPLFARLRGGMYRDGRGTWFNARYQLDRPSSYNLDFDREEPAWQSPPPPQAYVDELRFFPRAEENTPEWLRQRLAAARPEPPRPAPAWPRPARVFDGTARDGRPTINRPPLADAEREPLLAYLERAAVVMGSRGYEVDLLAPDARPTVPVVFHTDGVWVWPAALPYYLRQYGVPPEPELVEHIRSQGFQPPEVDETALRAAAAVIGAPWAGGPATPGTPPAGMPRPPTPPSGEQLPMPGPAEQGEPPLTPPHGPGQPPAMSAGAGAAAVPGMAGAPPVTEDAVATPSAEAPAGAEPAEQQHEQPEAAAGAYRTETAEDVAPAEREDFETGWSAENEAAADGTADSQAEQADADADAQELFELRELFADYDIPPSTYRIGEHADGAWCLLPHEDGWQVVRPEDRPGEPLRFAQLDDGAAYLIGRLVLDSARGQLEPVDVDGEEEPAQSPDDEFAHRWVDEPEGSEFAAEHHEVIPADPRELELPLEAAAGGPDTAEPPLEANQSGMSQDWSGGHRRAAEDEEPDGAHRASAHGWQESAEQADQEFAERQEFAEQAPAEQTAVQAQVTDAGHHAQPDTTDIPSAHQAAADEPDQDAYRDEVAEAEPAEQPASTGATEEIPAVTASGPPPVDHEPPTTADQAAEPVETRRLAQWETTTQEPAAEAEQPRHDEGRYVPPVPGQPVPGHYGPVQPGPGQPGPGAPGAVQHGQVQPSAVPHGPVPTGPMAPSRSAEPVSAEAHPSESRRPMEPPHGVPVGAGVAAAAVNGHAADMAPRQPASWPIQPLPGEPPLTLFRNKHVVELAAGTEVDRFGGPEGNVTYHAGTPFEHRSLVPDWVNRPYHVYRLQRNIEVIAGVAVPWFEQPGGGAAYVLPRSMEQLQAEGTLVELDGGDPPV